MAEYLTSSSQKLDRSSGVDCLAGNLWGGRYVKPKSPRWTQCGQSKRKKASATPLRKRYLWTSSTVEELTFLPVLYRHLRSKREDALCLAPPQGGVAAIEHTVSQGQKTRSELALCGTNSAPVSSPGCYWCQCSQHQEQSGAAGKQL